MMTFAIGIKDPLDVTVQRPHDADPGEHRRPAALCNEDQRFHCGLPFGRRVLGFRQLHDVGSGILQCEELPAIGKRYWILKRGGPGHGKGFSEMGGRGRHEGTERPLIAQYAAGAVAISARPTATLDLFGSVATKLAC